MPSVIYQAALSPLLTGTLLLLLTSAPSNLRETLLGSFRSPETAEKVILTLKWLFAIGLVSKLNNWLNDVAANNWLWREEKLKWTWSREIAVLTGGSSGIGALTAQGLARKMKVVVLDVQALPQHLKDREYYFILYKYSQVHTLTLLFRSQHYILPLRCNLFSAS